MPYPKKYAIIGRPRTGTTILACICNDHPDLDQCHFEPFLGKKIDDIKSMARLLYQTGDGIKEIVGLYCENNAIREVIFSLPIKIILIERENLLRQAVSYCLALRSTIWQNKKENHDYLERVSSVGDLSLDHIEHFIQETIKINEVIKNELEGKHYFHLVYEDFYFGSREYQIDTLNKMFEFIGVKPCVNDHMINVLDHGRLNNEDVYRSIKNVDEIEKKFSKYGQLFDRTLL